MLQQYSGLLVEQFMQNFVKSGKQLKFCISKVLNDQSTNQQSKQLKITMVFQIKSFLYEIKSFALNKKNKKISIQLKIRAEIFDQKECQKYYRKIDMKN